MRKQERIRQAMRRVARAETEANATILRAFDRVLAVLQRERTAMLIAKDREVRLGPQRKSRKGTPETPT